MSFPLEDDPLLTGLIDDLGDGISGSVPDKQFFLDLAALITDQVYDAANPTITPADLIQAYEDARDTFATLQERLDAVDGEITAINLAKGSLDSIDERLDVSLNEDGTLKSSGAPTMADVQSLIGGKNLWWDSLFNLWPNGDSSAPSDWVLAGTGAAVARTGVCKTTETSTPGDSTQMEYGQFAVKLTYGSDTATLKRTLISSGYMPSGLKGRTIGIGVRCLASDAGRSSLIISDGVNVVRAGSDGNASYADAGAETWIYGTITIDAAATKLEIYFEQSAAGTIIASAGVIVLSNYAPSDWFPERSGFLIIGNQQFGTTAVETTVNSWRPPMFEYCYLYDTKLNCKTAPTGTAIITKPSKGVGTFPYATTFPQIAAAATQGNLRPNGVYQNRCFKPDDVLTWDVSQKGSGTAGEDVNIAMKFITYPNEFLAFSNP